MHAECVSGQNVAYFFSGMRAEHRGGGRFLLGEAMCSSRRDKCNRFLANHRASAHSLLIFLCLACLNTPLAGGSMAPQAADPTAAARPAGVRAAPQG